MLLNGFKIKFSSSIAANSQSIPSLQNSIP